MIPYSARYVQTARRRARRRRVDATHTHVFGDSNGSDPQSDGAQERVHRAAICVRIVDVHVSCSSHYDTQLAAFFIDPRAKGSTGEVIIGSFIYGRGPSTKPGWVSCS